jgi:hypothetical protein
LKPGRDPEHRETRRHDADAVAGSDDRGVDQAVRVTACTMMVVVVVVIVLGFD